MVQGTCKHRVDHIQPHVCISDIDESPPSISRSSQLDMVMPGAVNTSEQNHPLVERQKLTCGVSVCRLPAVCRDFILSWCHTWSLLSLHTKESQVFRGPWSVPQRDLIGAIHRFVMRDANRQVLRKSQHLHSKRCVSAPRNVASFSKHNSRCTRSHAANRTSNNSVEVCR